MGQVSVLNGPRVYRLIGWPHSKRLQAQVPVGAHELSVSDACFKPASIQFDLQSGERFNRSVDMEAKETTLTLMLELKGESVLAQIMLMMY